MALYQGYDGGKINVNISGGSGVDKNGFTMKGDIGMDGNEMKGLGAPTDDTSAVTKNWVDNEIVKQASVTIQPAVLTMKGDIDMGGNVITNVTPGSDANNAATLDYVRSQSIKHLPLDGTRAMSGNLNMGSNEIKALGNPTTSRSAVTLEYMTGALNRPVSGLDTTSSPGPLRKDAKGS
jgi:hypothetical protein